MSRSPLVFFNLDGMKMTVEHNATEVLRKYSSSDCYYWILTLEGMASYTELERPQFLKPGTILAKQGPLLHQIRTHRQKSPWSIICLKGTNKFTMSRMNHVVQQIGKIQHIALSSKCAKLAQQLTSQKEMDIWDRSALGFNWFHSWWQDAEESKHQILEHLEKTPSADNPSWHITSLKGLADQLGYSPGYLSSVLAKKWDKSPAQSLRKARLEYAAKQLLETSIRVRELSDELGYMSESSFIRAFRMQYGRPPEKYRKHHEKNQGS